MPGDVRLDLYFEFSFLWLFLIEFLNLIDELLNLINFLNKMFFLILNVIFWPLGYDFHTRHAPPEHRNVVETPAFSVMIAIQCRWGTTYSDVVAANLASAMNSIVTEGYDYEGLRTYVFCLLLSYLSL